MERQQPWDPEDYGELPPVPLGANYEKEPDVLRRLQSIRETDPIFFDWVLSQSNEILEKLNRSQFSSRADFKLAIAQNLIEAYDAHQAKIDRDNFKAMYEND